MMISDLFNELGDNSKRMIVWGISILFLFLMIVGFLFILPYINIPNKISTPPRPTYKKADYSSDRSWLECRDHQLICLYGGLWEELSAKEILEICGQQEVCDDLFGATK